MLRPIVERRGEELDGGEGGGGAEDPPRGGTRERRNRVAAVVARVEWCKGANEPEMIERRCCLLCRFWR